MSDKPVILIVEDDPSVQGYLKTLMELEGYETMSATDGLEGLLKAEFKTPSVILLDVMMPNVDGERVIAELRERGSLATVPILVVTGRADAHATFDRVVGRKNVFPKPVDGDVLSARVAAVLRGDGA